MTVQRKYFTTRQPPWKEGAAIMWGHVLLALLEQYLQWRYGPITAAGLFLVALGMKEHSEKALCAGGILALLMLLSW
ncbi:hypothetical protein [Streptomyces sp. NPDC059479]|uniref:hypothetical protein n=1 Tax=Streptomyces sp. NPDC059479 TaxID=3346848 RepID=UPI00367CB9C7